MSNKIAVVYFALIVISCGGLKSQYQGNGSQLTKAEKDRLVEITDGLFVKWPDIAFGFFTFEIAPDFKNIPIPIKHDQRYLDSLLGALEVDESNSSILSKIAGYYDENEQTLLAQSYFEKAYENLDAKSFKDSAAYYSNRAVLKNRLGKKDGLEDLKKSLEINPNDSLAIHIYPILLMQNDEYLNAREVFWSALEEGFGDKLFAYMCLISAEVTEAGKQISNLEAKGVNVKKKYSKKNYDEIIDFSLIDKYAKMHPDKLEIVWTRRLGDIVGLFTKMTLLPKFEKNRILFPFTDYDRQKIESLIEQLSEASGPEAINEYSRNRCLAYLYFMKSEWDKSMTYFKKALKVFPDEKRDISFNTSDCQYMMMTMYQINDDIQNYRKLIQNKIENEPDRSKSVDDLVLLAYDYFQNGEIQKAEKLCNEVMLIDSNHFSTLRLKSHLSFLKGETQLAQFYLENAGKNLKDPSQEYHLTLQYAIYLIDQGNSDMARTVLESLELAAGSKKCPECETLIKEFCR